MSKTINSILVTDLAKRLDLDSTDATVVRVDMLRQLNVSLKALLQDHSLRFLITSDTITLNSAASSVAVPTTIDDGKTISLGRASGDGEIEYVPPDEFYRTHQDTYREPTQTEPSFYTIANVANTLTFLFKPGNTSGGSLTIPYLAQLIPVTVGDNSGATQLPEGWEDTLLLDHAEGCLRRYMNMSGWQDLMAAANDKKERLYSSYRTTKEQPMTDREQPERKAAREQYGPEKP